jgi:hypothetical protein
MSWVDVLLLSIEFLVTSIVGVITGSNSLITVPVLGASTSSKGPDW